jgi:hypothetical protein
VNAAARIDNAVDIVRQETELSAPLGEPPQQRVRLWIENLQPGFDSRRGAESVGNLTDLLGIEMAGIVRLSDQRSNVRHPAERRIAAIFNGRQHLLGLIQPKPHSVDLIGGTHRFRQSFSQGAASPPSQELPDVVELEFIKRVRVHLPIGGDHRIKSCSVAFSRRPAYHEERLCYNNWKTILSACISRIS